MKGRIINLQQERERRLRPSVDVEVEASVERGRVKVRLRVEGPGGWFRVSGLLEPAVAHEFGALLQRTAMRVPPPKRGA